MVAIPGLEMSSVGLVVATANNHAGENREVEEAATSMEGNSAVTFEGSLRSKLQAEKDKTTHCSGI
jgi:hypothetical protein